MSRYGFVILPRGLVLIHFCLNPVDYKEEYSSSIFLGESPASTNSCFPESFHPLFIEHVVNQEVLYAGGIQEFESTLV